MLPPNRTTASSHSILRSSSPWRLVSNLHLSWLIACPPVANGSQSSIILGRVESISLPGQSLRPFALRPDRFTGLLLNQTLSPTVLEEVNKAQLSQAGLRKIGSACNEFYRYY